MKKISKSIIIIFIFIILIACSKKDPVHDATKKDIILESGTKLIIDDIIDLEKIKDEKLLSSLKESKLSIDYKKTEINKEITDDKVIGTNKVNLIYSIAEKQETKDIDVKVKDTVAPKVKVVNDSISALQNEKITQEDFLKKIDIKVEEPSEYTIKVNNFEKIDFGLVKNNELLLDIVDTANNKTTIKVYLFVGMPPKTFEFNVTKTYEAESESVQGLLTITIPSSITSYYNVTLKEKEKATHSAYIQEIILSNDRKSVVFAVRNLMPTGYPGFTPKEYSINNYKVSIIGNESAFVTENNQTAGYFVLVTAKGLGEKEFTNIVKEVTHNTNIQ